MDFRKDHTLSIFRHLRPFRCRSMTHRQSVHTYIDEYIQMSDLRNSEILIGDFILFVNYLIPIYCSKILLITDEGYGAAKVGTN